MECLDARSLMEGSFDGGDTRSLEAHLAVCASCQREWKNLNRLEQLFRSEGLYAPPSADFSQHVLSRLDREAGRARSSSVKADARRGASWLPLATLVVGAIGVLMAVLGWHSIWPGFDVIAIGGPLYGAGATLGRAAIEALNEGAFVVVLYGALAGAMAAMWFGALVVPRRETDLAGDRPLRPVL